MQLCTNHVRSSSYWEISFIFFLSLWQKHYLPSSSFRPAQDPPTQVSSYMETRDEEREKFLVLEEKSDNKIGIILHSNILPYSANLPLSIVRDQVVSKLQSSYRYILFLLVDGIRGSKPKNRLDKMELCFSFYDLFNYMLITICITMNHSLPLPLNFRKIMKVGLWTEQNNPDGAMECNDEGGQR